MIRKGGKDKREVIPPKRTRQPGPVTVTVRATYIRDGTPGIGLSTGKENLGEWTDSKAESLVLERDYQISVRGKDRQLLYRIIMPGTPTGGEQVSDCEVTVTLQI